MRGGETRDYPFFFFFPGEEWVGGHGHTVLSTWVQALALLLLSSGAGAGVGGYSIFMPQSQQTHEEEDTIIH